MIITIEAEPKEVAALIDALQQQQRPITLYAAGIERVLQENPDLSTEENAKEVTAPVSQAQGRQANNSFSASDYTEAFKIALEETLLSPLRGTAANSRRPVHQCTE